MRMTQDKTTTCRRLSATDPSLVLITAGRKIVHLKNAAPVIVEAGSAVALPTGWEFDITNEVQANGQYRALAIYFDQAILPATVLPQTKAITTVTELGRSKSGLAQAMDVAAAALADDALPVDIAAHRMRELLLWIQAQGLSMVRPRTQSLLQDLRKLLATDPSAKWTTTQLASELAMSEATLRRKLAKLGTTLTDITIDVRMTSALAMLQTSEDTITSIAMAVGYDSPSRFALRFRDRFGVSPSDFRRG